jgi:hypothetical protein
VIVEKGERDLQMYPGAYGVKNAREGMTVAEQRHMLEKIILTRIMRLNALVHGMVTGVVVGLGIFLATNWLVLKGGEVVGPHLSLLGQFFIGYSVTFVGSLIGFAYGFAGGLGAGYFVASIYNRLADLRDGKRQDSI